MARSPESVTTCALVITKGHTPFLPHALEALAAQTRRPERIAIVDVSQADAPAHLTPDRLSRLLGRVYLIEAPSPTLGAAVAKALKRLTPDDDFLWILHDDCAPSPDCHAELVARACEGDEPAIVGPKQCTWADDTRLLEVGIYATARGHRVDRVDAGEIDQGQFDHDLEVAGVGTAGMLIERATWGRLGGTDPALGPFNDGWELCRRARLAGHRVVVAANARLRHARASFEGVRDVRAGDVGGVKQSLEQVRSALTRTEASVPPVIEGDEPVDHVDAADATTRLDADDVTLAILARTDRARTLRRRRIENAYAWAMSCPRVALPFVILAVVVLGLARGVWRVVRKNPRAARAEWAAAGHVFARLDRLVAARHRVGHVRLRDRRALKPYCASPSEAYTARRLAAKIRHEATRPVPLEPVAQAAKVLYRTRARVCLGVLVLLGFAAALGASSHLFTGLSGGMFATLPTRFGDLWDAAWSAWGAGGDGFAGPARPLLPLLACAVAPFALVGVSPTTTLEVAWCLAVPVAVLTAWVGAGAWVRPLPWRCLFACAWAAWPTLWLSWWSGDIGSVLVHVLLPLAAWGIAGASRLAAPDRWTTSLGGVVVEHRELPATTGAGVAALAIAGIGAAQPITGGVLVVLSIAVCGVQAVRRRTPRLARRGVLIVLPALLLVGPTLAHAFALGGATAWEVAWATPAARALEVPTASTLERLAGFPYGIVSAGARGLRPLALAATPALAAAAALLALARPRRAWHTRGAWVGIATGALALSFAPTAATTALAPIESLTAWSILLAASGFAGARSPARLRHLVFAAAAVAAASLLGGLAAGVATPATPGVTIHADSRHDRVPPAERLAQRGDAKTRLLVLSGGERPAARLWRGPGVLLTDTSEIERARPRDTDDADRDLADAIAQVVHDPRASVADRFAAHGIAEIVIEGEHEGGLDLPTLFTDADGLTRIGDSDSGPVWRVNTDALTHTRAITRAWIESSEGAEPVPSGASRVSTELSSAHERRIIHLAERADDSWHATLEGTSLARVDDGWSVAFSVPAGASGHLVITYGPGWWPWWRAVVTVSLAAAVAYALPLRRRKVM